MGRNQPSEELRKDTRYPGWGVLCQKNRKEGHVMGFWSGRGEASGRLAGARFCGAVGQWKEFVFCSNEGATGETSERKNGR